MKKILKKIIYHSTLAPSSHNSQPWKFEILNKSEIKIFPDFERSLEESDKNNRQLFISLGCALKNMTTSAKALGFKSHTDISDDGVITIVINTDHENVCDRKILNVIEKRVTNRNPYIYDSSIEKIVEFIKNNSSSDTKVFVCRDDKKDTLSDVAVNAGIEAMESPGFRRELSKYLKNNNTKSKIGMPAYGMGIPTPISYLAPIMIKFINMNKLSKKKDLMLLKEQTPMVVVVATANDDIRSWIGAGIMYQNIALKSEELGLSTAMWAAPIQIGENYKDFQKILDTELRPQAFFRLGKAIKQTKHSPRLQTNELIK